MLYPSNVLQRNQRDQKILLETHNMFFGCLDLALSLCKDDHMNSVILHSNFENLKNINFDELLSFEKSIFLASKLSEYSWYISEMFSNVITEIKRYF